MKVHKVIIADDEGLTRERIADLLSAYEAFKIMGKASNGKEAIQLINDINPDVLFLDIKMPLASGFDVLEQLNVKQFPLLIFVTAYDNYAVKAFEKEAFDYLVKPFSKARFEKVINRIITRLATPVDLLEEYLLVKKNGEMIKITTDNILYIESSNNNVFIHLKDQSYKKRTTISKMVQELNETIFLRVHRSFVVNINHIEKMRHVYHGDYLFTMANGKSVPTSRTYRQNVDRILNK